MQPEVNIGLVGHVDHGKTTLTQALSGIWTDTHSEEIKRGISIKLGYADVTIRKCPLCKDTEAYTTEKVCKKHNVETEIQRMVSLVDSPGHESLMATMLSGAALMDGAILVIAANEPCPQPQTKEHLMALDIIGVRNIVIAQNKIDIVSKERAIENYEEILRFIKGTVAENAPIVPISAQHKVNIDVLIEEIEKTIPTPKRDPKKPARMYIARSFDVNKPGTKPEDLKGGVLGGSLIQGELKIGDEIEIRPGIRIQEKNKVRYEPIYTEIVSLMAGRNRLEVARPGGLIGVGTKLDPSLTKADGLSGMMLGKPDTLPEVRNSLTMEVHLLQRIVGTREELEVEPIKQNETLVLNVGTATTIGIVKKVKKEYVEMILKLPVCAEDEARVAISRRIGGRWRLIGYGIIK